MPVDVKFVPMDALDAEWALVYSDDGTAYFIVRDDALSPKALRQAWATWEDVRPRRRAS